MKYEVNVYSILLIVLLTFLTSFLLMYPVIKLAKYLGAIDYPNEERRIHKAPTPRMGSIAIYLSFLLGYMVFGQANVQMISILISSFLLVLIGLFDDIKPIPNKYKLIVQIVAVVITVVYGGFVLKDLNAFGIYINFGIFKELITILFCLLCINSINLIDGMDGLSSGICSIFFLTIGIIAAIRHLLGGLDVVLAFSALGATLGYLKHNFHPAKIFMGDGGSMFLGYIISIIALLGYKNVTFSSFIVPLALLAIPIIDTLLAIFRRTIKKQNPLKTADKEHIHFQLLKASKSVEISVLIIYVIDMMFAAISIFYVLGDNKIAMFIYIILMLLLMILICKTDILYNHEEHRKKVEIRKKKRKEVKE